MVKMRAKGNTPLSAYAKGVFTDGIPEIGKRIINGDASEACTDRQKSNADPTALLADLLDAASRRLKSSAS